MELVPRIFKKCRSSDKKKDSSKGGQTKVQDSEGVFAQTMMLLVCPLYNVVTEKLVVASLTE